MQEKVDEFNRFSGKILNMALHIETHLEFFISNYFIKPQTGKTFFFEDIILTEMNFESKIDIFKKICNRENFEKNETNKIIKDIRLVQQIRNRIAHWQTEIMNPKEGVQLRKRKSMTTINDVQKLDSKLVNEIDDKRLSAIQGITKLYMIYQKEGTIDEKPFVEVV